MTESAAYSRGSQPDLQRFLDAQNEYCAYENALREINSGKKYGHWIWFIFPQITGLGHSYESHCFAISSIEEARAYLQHPVLGPRLMEISEALLRQSGSAYSILGRPDDLKVRSCITLFQQADPSIAVFQQVLDKFYQGKADQDSLRILEKQQETFSI